MSTPSEQKHDPFRSGFVALTGRPNAGKSTLVNQMAKMDLAIVSYKPQTTRTAIRAIIDEPYGQMILTDTPGILKPKNRLGQYMADAINRTVMDADVVILLADAKEEDRRKGRQGPEQVMLERLRETNKPVILVLNKVDLIPKETLLPMIAHWSKIYPFEAIVPISAKSGDGIDVLKKEIFDRLPEGPRYFPEDTLTDQTERVLASELIREQILRQVHEEIPHGTAVIINSFEEEFDGCKTCAEDSERTMVLIDATILCEKDSHKGILIGKGGSKLKSIGTSARLSIEKMLDCRCYLELSVKVREDWQNRPGILKDIGLSPER